MEESEELESHQSRTAVPVNGPGKGRTLEIYSSQREYRPTPFSQSAWQVIGERIEDRSFFPLEVVILKGDVVEPDPMFEVFAEGLSRDLPSLVHAPDPTGRVAAEEIAAEREIDPAMLEEIRRMAFEEGRACGRKEGEEELRTTIDERYNEIRARLESFHEAVRTELTNYRVLSERKAAELALAVAKKILVTTADVRPQYIIDVIRDALGAAGAGKPVRIRVAPQDYEFLQVIGLPAELSTEETGVEYVADENVSSGCVLETDFGEVDLQLEKMWEQVRETLYEVCQ